MIADSGAEQSQGETFDIRKNPKKYFDDINSLLPVVSDKDKHSDEGYSDSHSITLFDSAGKRLVRIHRSRGYRRSDEEWNVGDTYEDDGPPTGRGSVVTMTQSDSGKFEMLNMPDDFVQKVNRTLETMEKLSKVSGSKIEIEQHYPQQGKIDLVSDGQKWKITHEPTPATPVSIIPSGNIK